MVKIGRCHRRNAGCQSKSCRMPELEGRREIKFRSLLLNCLYDRLSVMPGIAAP